MPFTANMNPVEPVQAMPVQATPIMRPVTPIAQVEIKTAAPVQAPAPVAPVAASMPVLDEKAWEFCSKISHSQMLPAALRSTKDHDTTGDLYLICLEGHALGMNFIQAVTGFYCLPDQRPALYTQTKRALVMKAGGKFIQEEFDEQNGVAICVIRRDGIDYKGTFSVQDGINRGKLYIDGQGQVQGTVSRNGKATPWATDWRNMCAVRACSRACDKAYPDILMGLSSAEDVQDFNTPVEPIPTPLPKAKKAKKAEVETDKAPDLEAAIINPDTDL